MRGLMGQSVFPHACTCHCEYAYIVSYILCLIAKHAGSDIGDHSAPFTNTITLRVELVLVA